MPWLNGRRARRRRTSSLLTLPVPSPLSPQNLKHTASGPGAVGHLSLLWSIGQTANILSPAPYPHHTIVCPQHRVQQRAQCTTSPQLWDGGYPKSGPDDHPQAIVRDGPPGSPADEKIFCISSKWGDSGWGLEGKGYDIWQYSDALRYTALILVSPRPGGAGWCINIVLAASEVWDLSRLSGSKLKKCKKVWGGSCSCDIC